MATGQQVVDVLVQVTGKRFSTLDRLARHLKQSGKDLVPLGKPGGGKNAAHYSATHLVNFVLGLAADPISEAPEQVKQLAYMQPWINVQRGYHQGTDAGMAFSAWAEATGSENMMPAGTLREGLTKLIDWLSRPEGEGLRTALDQGSGLLYLDLVTRDGFNPVAQLCLLGFEDDASVHPGVLLASYGVGNRPQYNFVFNDDKTEVVSFSVTPEPAPSPPPPPGSIRKTIRIPYAVFDAVALLAADTRVVSATSPGREVVAANDRNHDSSTEASDTSKASTRRRSGHPPTPKSE